MQEYVIQKMYDFFGNEVYDERVEKLTSEILEKFGDKLKREEQEELLGLLMELDKSSFTAGIKSVCSFFTGKNSF